MEYSYGFHPFMIFFFHCPAKNGEQTTGSKPVFCFLCRMACVSMYPRGGPDKPDHAAAGDVLGLGLNLILGF